MSTIFLKILVIFLMVAIGFVAERKRILPEGSDGPLVDLIVDITCPCLILYSMADCEMTSAAITDTVAVLVGTASYFAISSALSYFFVKALHYEPSEDIGVLVVVAAAINTGFMGFPVTKAIFGDYLFFLMVIQNLFLNIYIFVVCPQQLHIGEPKKFSVRSMLRAAANPLTISTLFGFVLLLMDDPLPGFLHDLLADLGDVTVPLSMIIVGIQLAQRSVKEVLLDKKLVATCLFRMLALPILTFLAVNWLPLSPQAKALLVFAACFPTAVLPAAIALKEGKNATLLSSGIALTTLLSMATLPIAAIFLIQWYGL